MEKHLAVSQGYLHFFKSLNITDFMIKTLPDCSEFLVDCMWHGRREKCCSLFRLQRSEEGFCYSFNSLSQDRKKHCPPIDGFLIQNKSLNTCCPWSNTGSGSISGLQVQIRTLRSHEKLGNSYGVFIFIHSSYDFPEAGRSIPLRINTGRKVDIIATTHLWEATESLRDLPVEVRGCYFADERRLTISHIYSLNTCLMQCRHDYIVKMCKCQLYFFAEPNLPMCHLTDYKCIVGLTRLLRTMHDSEIDQRLDKPRCHCLPPCSRTMYDLMVRRTRVRNPDEKNYTGGDLFEVYFSNLGSTIYRRAANDLMTFFGDMGSVVNLFLGCSIISFIEIAYYFFISLWECYFKKKN